MKLQARAYSNTDDIDMTPMVRIEFSNPHTEHGAEFQYAKYVANLVNEALKEKGLYSDEVE